MDNSKYKIEDTKYIGHFNGEAIYGNDVAEKAFEWHRFNLEVERELNMRLETENFKLKFQKKTFLERLFG